MSDSFWYNDPSILWHSDRLTEFFPSKDHTLEEKLNAIVRLCFYLSVLLYLNHYNSKYISIFIGGCLLTYYIYINSPEYSSSNKKISEQPKSNKEQQLKASEEKTQKKIEGLENEQCTSPTLDNPFMNVTMKDLMNIDPEKQRVVNRSVACDINDPDIKRQIDDNFNNNLFRDINDVFGKMNSQRQFYTMPSTTIPNAQDDFAKWLYLNPKTCKEDQDYCLKYEDLRAKRPVLMNPNVNPVDTKRLEK